MAVHNKKIANLRVDYSSGILDEKDLPANPIKQFGIWFSEAIESKVNEPNAMTLATVKKDGNPTARIVLLKAITKKGLVFFTNYDSDKGKEILVNPNVAVVFSWLELQRQVRIEGLVSKINDKESDIYFLSRPRGSQIGAYASPQSKVVKNRAFVEARFEAFEKKFLKDTIIRPSNWGGYLVEPTRIEFWQGRQSRLHDRIRYDKDKKGLWKKVRLAP